MAQPIPVLLKFDEDAYNDDRRKFEVKMGLPASWAPKPCSKIVKFYVKKFNERYPDGPIEAARCRLVADRDRTIIKLDQPIAEQVQPHDELTIALAKDVSVHPADVAEAELQARLAAEA